MVATAAAFDARLSPALAACTPPPGSYASNIAPDCAAGTYNGPINPPNGPIAYDTNNGAGGFGIGLTLQPGVNIVIPSGFAGVNAVNAANSTGVTSGSANIKITADGVTINNTANPLTNNNTGLRIQSSGDAVVTATNTTIDVAGTASEDAIVVFAMPNQTGIPHLAGVTWSGQGLSSSGTEATGIQADNRGIGNATIVASGNITGTPGVGGAGFYGLIAHAGDSLLAPSGSGDASVTFNTGTINVSGNRPRGIVSWAEGDGSASVVTAAGTSIIVSGTNPGDSSPTQVVKAAVSVQLDSATAANNRAATVTVASTILNSGLATPDASIFNNPVGIRVLTYADAPITVTYTGPGITTQGGGGAGIMALSASGSITVNASGPINTTNGSNAIGILADTGTVLAQKNGLLTDTTTVHQGTVLPTSVTGAVQVTATNVSTLGQFATAISATSGNGGVTVNIPSGGSIMGGWQTDIAGVGSLYGLPASGVVLGSSIGGANLFNSGAIGALSDRAVTSRPLFASNNTSIFNNADGTITGFVQLVGSNNSIVNNGVFNLRHFADTDGDGVRDTLRVAVSDLGPGTFTNNGTLALLGAPGAIALDKTGQYLPLGFSFNTMALNGPVQGQILGATTFTNSGTIDLQANPVAGDVLLISGGHTPGTSGGGTFVSNGGRLLLDTVLNQGGSASQSDVLVIDNGMLGPGGPTRISVRNVGGAGALTVDNGILVVQSVPGATTAPGMFTLGSPVAAGPFDYLLFKGGVTPGNDNDWFLRNVINCAKPGAPVPPCPPPSSQTPIPPNPSNPIPPNPSNPNPPNPSNPEPPNTEGPVIPLFRPEATLYSKVPLLARQVMLFTLGTWHERQGDQIMFGNSNLPRGLPVSLPAMGLGGNSNVNWGDAAWGRAYGQTLDQRWAGMLSPEFNGHMEAVQFGLDVARFETAPEHSDRVGLFYAYSRTQGDGRGFVDGVQLAIAGTLDMTTNNIGAYWTHFGPHDWYIDAVLMGTFVDADPRSTRGIGASLKGDGVSASLETGIPFRLTPYLTVEPQAQLIWQHLTFNPAADPFTTLAFNLDNNFIGRLGLRVESDVRVGGVRLQPFGFAYLWHAFQGNDSTVFNDVISFPTPFEGTAFEIGGGVIAQVTDRVGLYTRGSYTTNVGGNLREALKGQFGVRMTW